MTIYKCNKCSKQFDRKSSYMYHVHKKKVPCKLTNVQIAHKNDEKCGYKCANCNKSYSRKDSLDRHIKQYCKRGIIKYTCKYCNQIFSRNSSLKRHINQFCKVMKQCNDEKETIYQTLLSQVEYLKEENSKLKNKLVVEPQTNSIINNVTNTTNTINTTNNTQNFNIKIIAFGKEDLGDIFSEEAIKKYITKGYQSVKHLINDTHFDKNRPELHNVYISNMKDVYAMTYDGTNWALIKKDEVVNQLFDDKQCFLMNSYTELKGTLNPIAKRKFERFLAESSGKIIDDLKHDIKLLLYNKRGIPMSSRNGTKA